MQKHPKPTTEGALVLALVTRVFHEVFCCHTLRSRRRWLLKYPERWAFGCQLLMRFHLGRFVVSSSRPLQRRLSGGWIRNRRVSCSRRLWRLGPLVLVVHVLLARLLGLLLRLLQLSPDVFERVIGTPSLIYQRIYPSLELPT